MVLIDFGKATGIQESKRYHLNDVEKIDYFRNFPHVAPEVVEGETKQTKCSDIYAFVVLLFRVVNQGVIDRLHSLCICSFCREVCLLDIISVQMLRREWIFLRTY